MRNLQVLLAPIGQGYRRIKEARNPASDTLLTANATEM
jgi:hypothetical protein